MFKKVMCIISIEENFVCFERGLWIWELGWVFMIVIKMSIINLLLLRFLGGRNFSDVLFLVFRIVLVT